MKQCKVILLLSFALLATPFLAITASADEFTDAALQLNEGSFNAKRNAVDAFADFEDERTAPILQAMMDGNLLAHKKQPVLAIKSEADGKESYIDAFTQSPLDNFDETQFAKVRTNNGLRRHIRLAIAKLELRSPSLEKRLQASENFVKDPPEDLIDQLRESLQQETNAEVKNNLALTVALIDLQSNDKELKLTALKVLGNSHEQVAFGSVSRLLETNDDGSFKETDEEIRVAAQIALTSIERKQSVNNTIQTVLFGISGGSILLLAAVGLAITFGVMGVINMAHGEMIMIGAYATFAIQQLFPSLIAYSVIIAIPLAFFVAGGVGVATERLVIRHLYGRPLDTLLATFGISLILQQTARIYNSNNVPVEAPAWMQGSFEVFSGVEFTYNRFYIILFCILLVVLLTLILKRTFFGLQMRAVTQNRPMANAMGIKSGWVDAMTFGLGSGVAGIAGVAASQITNVGPNLGQSYIILSFMVVVFGGVGNIFGAAFAAFMLGIVKAFLEPVVGAVVAQIVMLVFIILFIQWKPRGLFPVKGRAAES